MSRRAWVAAVAVGMGVAWGCQNVGTDGVKPVVDPPVQDAGVIPVPVEQPPDAAVPVPIPDEEIPVNEDGGSFEIPDSGIVIGEPPPLPDAGTWHDEALANYTERYALGPVQSVSIDAAWNLWLLEGTRIGVLKLGATAPVWAENVGQAGNGYPSTVICGGPAGRAYVGYGTTDLVEPAHVVQPPESASYWHPNYIFMPNGCGFGDEQNDCDPARYSQARFDNYQAGDLDLVRLDPDTGLPVLEEHLWHSISDNAGKDYERLPNTPKGIRNTNDHRFDEDRKVLSCTRVMRGDDAGDLYIGTNHGVTRVRGNLYNSHRHANDATGKLIGYVHGLAVGQNNDVLVGNAWMFGAHIPTRRLAEWDRQGSDDQGVPYPTKDRFIVWLEGAFGPVSRSNKADWKAVAQTVDGLYYAGSNAHGLYQVTIKCSVPNEKCSQATGALVEGAPSVIWALAATDDGSLYIGGGDGLWKLDNAKGLTKVEGIPGAVRQLVYDPTVTRSMLLVLNDQGTVYVLRGP